MTRRSEREEPPPCVACGEPATRRDIDGVPLCEGDWERLVDCWRREFRMNEILMGVVALVILALTLLWLGLTV
jgi:hypothetical protein